MATFPEARLSPGPRLALISAGVAKSPEGDGNMLDRTVLVYVHEHAEANSQKTSASKSACIR
jgi:hypothetical protein